MKIHRYLQSMVCGAFLLFAAGTLHAQATRTWVSGLGDDANPCSRTAPCKTFPGAYSRTAAGGEIDVIDPGGYGTISIGHAITIDGGTGSGWASILGAGTNAANVNAGASDVVILRHISFQGVSQYINPGLNGINYNSGGQLIIEKCVFENFTTTGINESAMTSSSILRVNDCSFTNTNTGILVTTSSGFATAQIDRCNFNGGATGVNTTSNAFVSIRDCMFAQTTSGNGAVVSNGGCQVNVTGSMFASNALGAFAGGVVRLSDNDFFNNTTAIAGTAASANDNRFGGNGTDGATANVIVVK